MTPQQRYGLGAAPAGSPKPMGGLAQKRKTKAVTVSGKPKAFADGGSVRSFFAKGLMGLLRQQLTGNSNYIGDDDEQYAKGGKVKRFADGGKVEGGKTLGPATAEGRPIGYGDIADVTVNTAKGIGRSFVKTIKGDQKGADEELDRTRQENREISNKAADREEAKRTINGAPIHNLRPANLPAGSGGVRG